MTLPPDFGVSAAPLRKRRLADEIYAQILLQLSTGQYRVGDRLPTEKELSASFDVSRPVVREALQHLQNDGLIDARRGSGTFVRRLPPHEMAHYTDDARIAQYMRAYEVRRGLEVDRFSGSSPLRTGLLENSLSTGASKSAPASSINASPNWSRSARPRISRTAPSGRSPSWNGP